MKLPRNGRLTQIVVGLLLLSVIVWTYTDLTRQEQLGFEYTDSLYLPEESNVCPGDTLRYNIAFSINDVPLNIRVWRNWRGIADDGSYFHWEGDSEPIVFIRDVPGNFEFTQITEVPELPQAGNYELVVGADEGAHESTYYVVPFTLPETCFS